MAKMPLSVTDPDVGRLTKELARRHGISKTEVIRQALRHEAARDDAVSAPKEGSDADKSPAEFVEKTMAFR